MSHIVIHPGPDGKPGFHPVASLEEATRLVDLLRDEHGVAGARVFRLEEVHMPHRADPAHGVDPGADAAGLVPGVRSPARLGLFGR